MIALYGCAASQSVNFNNRNHYDPCLVQNIVDIFTKLSKIGSSVECFRAGFLHIFFLVQLLKSTFFGGRLGNHYQLQAFRGFS